MFNEVQVSEIKSMVNSQGRGHIAKELQIRIDLINQQLDAVFKTNSAGIFDEKVHKQVVGLNYEKYVLETFMKTPQNIIDRLNVTIS